ncbi:MAG: type II secretion system protein M [Methylococcaceae bacterium]|nr:type II secretion system protein M [Methylococcaceae bacterium]
MKSEINDILQRLAAFSPRERWLAAGGSVFVIFYGLYLLVYNPIATEKTQLDHKINAQQMTYQQLARITKEARELQKKRESVAAIGDKQTLMAIVEASGNQLAITPFIKSMLPDGEETMNLNLENIPFDQLIYWLVMLDSKHDIHVNQITVARDNKLGIVNAKVALLMH